VCDAVVAARDPHFFPEHRIPHHRPRHLLLWEADQPDHVEDVTDWIDRKLDALEAHASQFESTMKAIDDEQLGAFRTRIRERLEALGAPHGVGAAEIFKRIDDL
jgi:LmbE family N-acetylglucosaminyl deacetylase